MSELVIVKTAVPVALPPALPVSSACTVKLYTPAGAAIVVFIVRVERAGPDERFLLTGFGA